VFELELLRAEHERAVLDFELANREYFAAAIGDREDDFFTHFSEMYEARLAEQASGEGAYYLAIADRAVVGRFNLLLDEPGIAVLGYRVAKELAGRGVATAAVRELCLVAWERHGVHTLRAATSHTNIASQRVLIKAGFMPVSPASPSTIGGKEGICYQRDLVGPSER
jgi:ribosomal-protein-alanine N-acetyltransferase